jgi:cytochrome P450
MAAPPGPKGGWFSAAASAFRDDQLGFYESCARQYGDVVATRLGPYRVWLIYHPDAIEEMLVTRARDFVKSPGVRRNLRPLLGNGLLLSEGDFWLRQRRLAQPAFHRQRVAGYGDVMAGFSERHVAGWADGATLEVHGEMMALTQAIVGKTLFDADVSGDAHDAAQAAKLLAENFGARLARIALPFWVPTPGNLRARRAIRRLDAIVDRIIAERRAITDDRGDLLSMLVQAQDADDGTRMTPRQLRDEVMTIFLAGHETTAVTLSWTWYLLAQHPEVRARLDAELRAALDGRPPAAEDLPRLAYTAAIVSESLRLFPPAYGLGRQAAGATTLGGYPIPRGDIVIAPTWVVHRDRRWFDEPGEFRPERWADDLARRLPRFAYFPFGGGPRQCIGNTFALMEATLILAAVSQRVRLELEPGQRITPVPYVTLRPEPGIRVRVTRR